MGVIGVLKLFFDGVCGPSLKPLHISEDFTPQKMTALTVFKIFANSDLFLRVSASKTTDLPIFHNLGEKMGPSKVLFMTKMGPLPKDFR